MKRERVEDLVEAVIKEKFPSARVAKVIVKPDVGEDGDEILRIYVAFEDVSKAMDRNALVGLIRHLKTRLVSANHDEFPLLSFISKADIKKFLPVT
ncbi:MAG: hypothetical protein K6U10_02570 [Acidobacteriia bacterium]|nr:hypothetical protein [Methyloceanibacter sp.]MCL6490686.1 hypothetical protein [Terriglobia bacterium]